MKGDWGLGGWALPVPPPALVMLQFPPRPAFFPPPVRRDDAAAELSLYIYQRAERLPHLSEGFARLRLLYLVLLVRPPRPLRPDEAFFCGLLSPAPPSSGQ